MARRLRRPSWRDPRLVVGLALVLASVVLVALVVQHADDTRPVWAARRALTPGEQVTSADLVVRDVRVAGGDETYLPATGDLAAGQVVLRYVGAGELLPRAAVGPRDQVDLRPVAVPVSPEAADGLQPGALVDVWVADRSDDRQDAFERPRLVAAGAQVSALTATHGALGGTTTSAVRLLLTPDLVPVVVEAVDNEARVTLVPVPATLAGTGS
ncbi:flagellar protein FlgA [Angustibacter peucedani]